MAHHAYRPATLVLGVSAVAAIGLNTRPAAYQPISEAGVCNTVSVERVVLEGYPKAVRSTVALGSQLLVLDGPNHRVLVFDPVAHFARQIGWIGQDTGSLWKPHEVAVDRQGLVYVLNDGGQEVKVFSNDGAELRRVKLETQASGLAVDSRGRILVGEPHRGSLISIYDNSGKRLKGFGTLRRPSEILGQGAASRDTTWRTAFNRVRLALDGYDNVYVVFTSVPVLEKFDANGALLLSKPVVSERTNAVLTALKKGEQAPSRQGYISDGASLPLVSAGIAVSTDGARIYVPYKWDTGWIFVGTGSGEAVGCLVPTPADLAFENVVLIPDGSGLYMPRLSAEHRGQLFRLRLPGQLRPKITS